MAVALLLHPLRRQLEVVVVVAGVLDGVVAILDGVVATILVAGVAIMVAGVAILGKSSMNKMNESMNQFISL